MENIQNKKNIYTISTNYNIDGQENWCEHKLSRRNTSKIRQFLQEEFQCRKVNSGRRSSKRISGKKIKKD